MTELSKIKNTVVKLDAYRAKMRDIRDLEKERIEIKDQFLSVLEPGQTVIGRYSVKTEEHETKRLMSINDARLALAKEGYDEDETNKILTTLTNVSMSRQFLVRYNPTIE